LYSEKYFQRSFLAIIGVIVELKIHSVRKWRGLKRVWLTPSCNIYLVNAGKLLEVCIMKGGSLPHKSWDICALWA
jgi:hypothetical protein